MIAFVLLGHVFTSAMTGNTALLGLALGKRDTAAAGRSAFALAGFLCGIVAATWLRPQRAARSLRPLFLVEMQGLAARGASRFGMTTIVFTSALLRMARRRSPRYSSARTCDGSSGSRPSR